MNPERECLLPKSIFQLVRDDGIYEWDEMDTQYKPTERGNNMITERGNNMMFEGQRIRIREGYEMGGTVLSYIGRSLNDEEKVIVSRDSDDRVTVLASAIEAFPFTEDERIERMIDAYEGLSGSKLSMNKRAAMYAVLQGVWYGVLDTDGYDNAPLGTL